MRAIALAALLPLLLATPAAAQQSSIHEAACSVHQNNQMRCAVSFGLGGNHRQRIFLFTSGGGDVTGDAQAWLSECGLPGTAGPIRSIANRSDTVMIRETSLTAASVICPEVFIFNCRRAGQPVDCSAGFRSARIRVELNSR